MQGLHIAELHFQVAQGWWLLQNDGVRVNLGLGQPKAQLFDRYQRFLHVRSQLPQEQLAAIEYADVRYANGVALKSHTPVDAPLLAEHAEPARTVLDGR